jgi:hypothetical protein
MPQAMKNAPPPTTAKIPSRAAGPKKYTIKK